MPIDKVDITILNAEKYAQFPRMVPVEQRFPADAITDVAAHVRQTVGALPKPDVKGKSIAITAGSRGIPNIVEILATVVSILREWGAEPFIVPAMGSHGNANAEGQKGVLTGYGITEESVGAPIRASMEVVQVAEMPDGTPLYCDKHARSADGIVVCNKIKAHSNYKADYESGLAKMMVIGLGKHVGATQFHNFGFARFHEMIPTAGARLLEALPVVFALGLVENAYSKLAIVEALQPKDLLAREKELLVISKKIMGQLLMPSIDLLIIDEIGKDISGQGMDPNVTGRASSGLPGFVSIPIGRIIVRGISEPSHGNIAGIGTADLMTLKCFNEADLGATYTNGITARNLEGAKLPMIANSDHQAMVISLMNSPGVEPSQARIVRIKNTKKLQHILVSEAYLPELRERDDFAILGEPKPFAFDAAGSIID